MTASTGDMSQLTQKLPVPAMETMTTSFGKVFFGVITVLIPFFFMSIAPYDFALYQLRKRSRSSSERDPEDPKDIVQLYNEISAGFCRLDRRIAPCIWDMLVVINELYAQACGMNVWASEVALAARLLVYVTSIRRRTRFFNFNVLRVSLLILCLGLYLMSLVMFGKGWANILESSKKAILILRYVLLGCRLLLLGRKIIRRCSKASAPFVEEICIRLLEGRSLSSSQTEKLLRQYKKLQSHAQNSILSDNWGIRNYVEFGCLSFIYVTNAICWGIQNPEVFPVVLIAEIFGAAEVFLWCFGENVHDTLLVELLQESSNSENHRLSDVFKRLQNRVSKDSENGTVERYDIYISHAFPEREQVAIPLYHALQAYGVRCFLHEKVFATNRRSITKQVTEAIKHSKVVVFILSVEFLSRRLAMFELKEFLKRHEAAMTTLHGSETDAPFIIPLFYTLSARDCMDENLLIREDVREILFQRGFFNYPRQKEMSVADTIDYLRKLRDFRGIRNDDELRGEAFAKYVAERIVAEIGHSVLP